MKISDAEIDNLLSGSSSYYKPTIEDSNSEIAFNNRALVEASNLAFCISELSHMYKDYNTTNYVWKNSQRIISETESSINTLKMYLANKKLITDSLAYYKGEMFVIKKRIIEATKRGLFNEHKEYLVQLVDAVKEISETTE